MQDASRSFEEYAENVFRPFKDRRACLKIDGLSFDGAEPNNPVSQEPPRRLPQLSGLTILLVDDHEDSLATTATLLRLSGAIAITAANGEEAIGLMRHSASPDLVITDLAMPVMDGYELVRRLRSAPATLDVPVIGYSAFPTYYISLDKFDAFFRKPYDFDELCATIRRLVSTRRQRRTGS